MEDESKYEAKRAGFLTDSNTGNINRILLVNGLGNGIAIKREALEDLNSFVLGTSDSSQKRIEERDGKYCVISETTGRSFGCYPTKEAAQGRLEEIEHFKDQKQEDNGQSELDQVFADYHALVNMSYSELKEWSENECSKKASLTRGPIMRNLRLLSKKKEDWTEADVRDANKTIAFISRMMRMPDGDNVSEECPYSKREISLKNWAFDPRKASKAFEAVADVDLQFAFVTSEKYEVPEGKINFFGKEYSYPGGLVEASKADEDEQFVLGIVLEPTKGEDGEAVNPDLQGEIYGKAVIRETAHNWMIDYRKFDYQHKVIMPDRDVVVVESYLTPFDGEFTLADGTKRRVLEGTWIVGCKVLNSKLWAEIKAGKITGYSMNGFAKKVPVRKSASKIPLVLCFYHNDPDGQLSAAILDKSIGPDTDIDFVPITYGNDFPWMELAGRSAVFMLDFSLQPFSDMEILAEVLDGIGIDFVWIDHHKSKIEEYAESELKGKIRGVQKSEPGEAACFLTWKFLFEDEEIPAIVDYVSKWDTWVWKDNANIRPVILAIMADQLRKVYIGTWHSALDKSEDFLVDTYKSDGLAIIRWIEHSDKERMQRAFPVEFEGLNVIAVNTDAIGSNQFDSAKGDYDAGIAFGLKPGFGWDVHMYALKDGVDVGSICKKHGGGGHEGSGGFQCMQLPFVI